MKARLAVYTFLSGFATVMEDPDEDIPLDLAYGENEGIYPEGLTPEDIAEAATFIANRIQKEIAYYKQKTT